MFLLTEVTRVALIAFESTAAWASHFSSDPVFGHPSVLTAVSLPAMFQDGPVLAPLVSMEVELEASG